MSALVLRTVVYVGFAKEKTGAHAQNPFKPTGLLGGPEPKALLTVGSHGTRVNYPIQIKRQRICSLGDTLVFVFAVEFAFSSKEKNATNSGRYVKCTELSPG